MRRHSSRARGSTAQAGTLQGPCGCRGEASWLCTGAGDVAVPRAALHAPVATCAAGACWVDETAARITEAAGLGLGEQVPAGMIFGAASCATPVRVMGCAAPCV